MSWCVILVQPVPANVKSDIYTAHNYAVYVGELSLSCLVIVPSAPLPIREWCLAEGREVLCKSSLTLIVCDFMETALIGLFIEVCR